MDVVSGIDPPPINSGMVGLNLDPQGRLIQFDAVPPQLEEKPDTSRLPDWPALFTAAGLDMARFTPAEPRWVPLADSDARAAWAGSYAQAPELPLRVETASWRGKPVFFRVIGPWSRPERMQPVQSAGAGGTVFLAVLVIVDHWLPSSPGATSVPEEGTSGERAGWPRSSLAWRCSNGCARPSRFHD